VRAAYGLPRGTKEEKAIRSEAVQAAWTEAARVPLKNAGKCAQVLELAVRLEGRSNLSAASDLECAHHLGRAGLLGCVANVDINISEIRDVEVAGELAEQTYILRELVT
jgi:formiminotetrahydrofolate cyclodeaminase